MIYRCACIRLYPCLLHVRPLIDSVYVLLCGRPNRPQYRSCLSVCPSVCPIRLPTRKQKWKSLSTIICWTFDGRRTNECVEKLKVAWTSPRAGVTGVPIFSSKGAMATTRVTRGYILMTPLNWPTPKPYHRTKNYDSMLYTTEVMTVWIIFKFSPFGAHCNFFWIFEINNLIVKFKFSNAQKAIHCAKPRHMSHRALKSVQSFLLQAAKRKGKGWVGKVQKVTKALYFTYSWGSPLWTDFNQILHVRRYGGRNHLCKFGYGQIEGLGKYGGQSLGSSVETTGHPYNSAALQHSLRLLSSSSSSSLKCVCVANM